MTRRRRLVRRVLIGASAVLVLALVGSVVTTVLAVRRPLPTHSGQLRLSGLDDEVTVLRDARGVPTITATSAHDLFLAQGYTDAQDRFFLMDYRRHVASGTLAALVGTQDGAVAADTMVRTLGWRQVAEAELDLLSPTTRQYLQAYADGVNAYLSGRSPGEIAVEYTVLGLHRKVSAPARWTPVDSLVWLKAMAWDLRSNDDAELARAQALLTLGNDPAAVAALFPAYPADTNAPIITDADAPDPAPADAVQVSWSVPEAARALGATGDALAAVPHLLGDGAGANSWVVSGERTASGRPLLAADLHLAVSQPGVWSQVGLRCAQVSPQCPFDVSGFSTAGFPGVTIGHNADLAWAVSSMGADVTDLFVERVIGDEVLVDGVRRPLTVRQETIEVAGGAPVTITVRSTGHGPIVSDALDTGAAGQRDYRVALGWAALTPGVSADAVFALSTASDADQVRAAAASFQDAPLGVVFATTDGHIGYQAAGRVPVRGSVVGADPPTDGTWPRLGWDSSYDWQGWLDPAELPGVLDPADGFVVAANQQVGAGPYLTGDWDYGYRAQRIRDLVEQAVASGPVDMADMQRIALDKYSPAAGVLLDTLRKVDLSGLRDDSWSAAGQDLLQTWDGQMDADSPAAMYFAAVWRIVLAQTFSDELPADVDLTGDSRSVELVRQIVDDPQSRWWDSVATPRVVENRDEVLIQALVTARKELTAQLGSDPKTWRWGAMHRVEPAHPVLGDASWPVRWMVNADSKAVGGSSVSLDATAWQPAGDQVPGGQDDLRSCYTVTTAPSMRMVVDLADLDSSTWVNLAGTSGHPASSHYADQLTAWAAGKYYPWPFSAAAVRADAKQTLRLVP